MSTVQGLQNLQEFGGTGEYVRKSFEARNGAMKMMQTTTATSPRENATEQYLVRCDSDVLKRSAVGALDARDLKRQPHTPNQDLTHFGTWNGPPIWVPPTGYSKELAQSMLDQFGPFASKAACWKAITKEHRSKFTQVREITLPRASIRLPKGRLFVTVTEADKFDEIKDPIPACVQTRLDEFLAGKGKERNARVYYLKPLCVEVGNQLVFTTQTELEQAISQVQAEVFSEYRRQYLQHRARGFAVGMANAALAIPRSIMNFFLDRKKREIESFHSKLEFERRHRVFQAMSQWNQIRRDRCSFDDVLSMTSELDRVDVIDCYVEEKGLSEIDRQFFLVASAVVIPWFLALSVAAYQLSLVTVTTVTVTVCDPVFVAEMPGSQGRLLKIGHFDEVDGVMHVEI